MPSSVSASGAQQLQPSIRPYEREVIRPPGSNTGVERTTGLDYIAGTVRGHDPRELALALEGTFGPATELKHGTGWYGRAWRVGQVSLIGAEGRGDAAGTVFVELKGSDLTGLDYSAQVALLAGLKGLFGLKVTRLDPYIDTWGTATRPELIRDAFVAGRAVTRTVRRRFMEDNDGQTFYVGSRHSEFMGRFYEKGEPDTSEPSRMFSAARRPRSGNGGARAARLRAELELKGPRADAYAERLLAEYVERPGELVAGVLRQLVDFRDRQPGEPHGERAPMLAFWAEIVGDADRIRLAVGVKVRELVERARWFVGQMSRTLAVVRLGFGPRLLEEMYAEGLDRLSARDRWQLAAVGVTT